MNKKNSIKHFLAGILCCVMIINLIFSEIGLASEDNTNKNYSINYANFQFLSTSNTGYIPNENIDKKMVIEKDGYILVDIFWICNKMGLNLEQKISKEGFISEVKEKENYYIKEMFKGYQSVFENTREGMEFRISKENSYFTIYFRENSASAYAYSPYMGDIKVQLGTEIIKTINEEQIETYWVPLVMFLNLFDSYYQIDNNNIINIYPYVTTVVDILHKNDLNDYFFDVTKDSGLSRFDIFIAGTYNDFYITFKKMFKSIVDSNAWIETGNNSLYYGEIMATQLSTYSTDELIKLNRQNILASNCFSIYFEEAINWSEEVFNAAVDDAQTLLENAENIYNSLSGFSRFDEYNKALSKATKAAKDASSTLKLYQGFKMSTDIAPLAITAYVKYITINNEIGMAEQKYVDAIKEYINAVEKYCNRYMDIIEKNAINNFTYIKNLNEKVKLYDGGKKNIFENEEYINAVIEEVIKSQLPNIQADFQEYFFNLNSNLLLKFKGVSLGWDILEEISDSIFNGVFSSLNALECSLYTQILESDSMVIIDELKMEMSSNSNNIEKYLETYRQLELIRLKSFYLVRKDIIDFYQTQKSSPYYETALSDIFNDCEELCELMAILISGTTGITQNSMTNVYEKCKDTNKKLIESGAILKEMPITSVEYEMREEKIEFYTSDDKLAYTNTIIYPYFCDNSLVGNKINEYFNGIIQDLKNNNTSNKEWDMYYQMAKEISDNLVYYSDIEASIMYNDRGIISLLENQHFWDGGVHPYSSNKGYIYDLNTGEELTYLDIIDGTQEQIDKLLMCYWIKHFIDLDGQLGYTDTFTPLLKKLKEYTGYILLEEGLCFYYHIGDSLADEKIIIPYTEPDTYIISAEKLLSNFDTNIDDGINRNDLINYTNIAEVANSISNMVDASNFHDIVDEDNIMNTIEEGVIEGKGYVNNSIIVESEYNDESIKYINIFNECDYSILGLYYGINQNNARYYLIIEKDWMFVQAKGIKEQYIDNYGNSISLYLENGKVISISYFIDN